MAQNSNQVQTSQAYDSIRFNLILPPIKAMSKKQVLQKFCEQTARVIGVDEKFLLDSLLKRENQNSSGIGKGISIPHMTLPRLTKPFIVFAKLDNSIDFDSVDSLPVDLVCLVLSPEHEGPKHLRRLAGVTRVFQDAYFCNKLRDAKDRDDIQMVLQDVKVRKYAA